LSFYELGFYCACVLIVPAVSNFAALINSEAMAPVVQRYCVYHIDAPGQEENATTLPTG